MIDVSKHPADFFLDHNQQAIDRIFQGDEYESFRHAIPKKLRDILEPERHGHWQRWLDALEILPNVKTEYSLNSDAVTIGTSNDIDPDFEKQFREALMAFHPWRKGPWNYFGIDVDTEWRSNLKWNRVSEALDLKDKNILDVGSGNGYYGWRMIGEGARSVCGVDPSINFCLQFLMSKVYMPQYDHVVLPFVAEDLPEHMNHFDVVFTMGVLYHRRSPIDHLARLQELAKPGGEVVVETLVIDGKRGDILVPDDRYAKMRNVWFLPSIIELEAWLKRLRYVDIRVVDVTQTTVEEQRSTDWMTFRSLPDFLDPKDPTKTVEGYPAPKRATIIARRPYT